MIEPESYCRELEAYLCRKNDGHLIRITGPAFEHVSAWARQGIPINVACEGIDRYFERYYRKGPRRRPVRIEFCEADVLDVFDAWRRCRWRAAGGGRFRRTRAIVAGGAYRTRGRAAHVHACEFTGDAAFRNAGAAGARPRRSASQREISARRCARCPSDRAQPRWIGDCSLPVFGGLGEAERATAETNAREQLAPFRERMTIDAYQRACVAATERQLRDHFGLPTIAFE